MGILNYKNDKTGKIIDMENYSEVLKFEMLEYFSSFISTLISNNDYQGALSYVEGFIDRKFEIPLRIQEESFHNNLNGLIVNEKAKFMNFFIYLKNELLSCKKFYFIVSFIKFSGIQLLISTFDELESRGIKGEVVTSVYLSITEPKALKKLLSYNNIKVKIYNSPKESFHTKAYVFEKEKYHTCIIGSSNISQSALYSAEEWNIKLTDSDFFNIFEKSMEQFRRLWNSNEAIDLTDDYIARYEEYRKGNSIQESFDYRKSIGEEGKFLPNSMQEEILEKLRNTRKAGNNKGLVVAATGTGKTYLAAMDVKQFFKELYGTGCNIDKISILFIAHREELLESSIDVFSLLLGIGKERISRIFGGKKETEGNIVFASVQSLKNCFMEISSDKFLYIIVDEFHHAAAESYKKIIGYFKSRFFLGLTATPERMDGKDILELCGYNIVGEIGLKKAMERDLIAPFHYFGVADIVDYEKIPYKNGKYNEERLSENLSMTSRVDYIIEKIKKFGYDGNEMRAIAFCQNIGHALYMKNEFQNEGYKSDIIISETNATERSKILSEFRDKKIEILCVVDILNEGIDIPDINLLLFLRPTLSSTVFIQQLGRGLRKAPDKEFVTVIDFIGNHQKDYIVAKVFSEGIYDRDFTYNKKEKFIEEIRMQFGNIPGASNIELDRICQKRIIEKIEKISFSSRNMLKEIYMEYKNEIGKNFEEYLKISDFDSNIELFMELSGKMGSFYNAQVQFEDEHFKKYYRINSEENDIFAYMERKLKLCEPFTYIILGIITEAFTGWQANKGQTLSGNIIIDPQKVIDEYRKFFSINKDFSHLYLVDRIFKEMEEDGILDKNLYGYSPSKRVLKVLERKNRTFLERIRNLVILGLNDFRKNDVDEFNEKILITHKEYMRIELQILLDSQVPKGTWRAGYANTEKDICLFITNDKSHIVQENLKYDNSLHADDIIQWISQPKTFHSSSVGQMFIRHEEMGIRVHIFARKYAFADGNKTNPFIYLGQASYYESYGDKPMTILWKLRHRIPQQIINELYR